MILYSLSRFGFSAILFSICLLIGHQSNAAPLTLEQLKTASPAAAAALTLQDVLGPDVELVSGDAIDDAENPWSGIVTLYGKPHGSDGICEVMVVGVRLDPEVLLADSGGGGRVSVSDFHAARSYYVDDSQPISPDSGRGNAAKPSCANPVGRRVVFEAESFAAAGAAVKELQRVVEVMNGTKPLPFALDVPCVHRSECINSGNSRIIVGRLKTADISEIYVERSENYMTWCINIKLGRLDKEYWNIKIVFSGKSDDIIKEVSAEEFLPDPIF